MSHAFAQYIQILGRGKKGSRSLTQQEAYDAMSMILSGLVEDLQLGAFLMLLRVKEESPEEMAGFVQACRQSLPALNAQVDVDWSSYAGKRRHLPWFVLAQLALAQYGISIFTHGSEGHTPGRVYTRSVFKTLGLPLATDFEQASKALTEYNLCYLPLESFLPKLEHIIQLKPILGLRSPANSFVRMLNPYSAKLVMQGIFHPAYNGIHQRACSLLDFANTTVIKGDGGEIERNPEMQLTSYRVVNGDEQEEIWPVFLEKREVKPDSLDIAELVQTWRGKTHTYGEAAVISTMAVVLASLKTLNQTQALELAQEIWQQRNKTAL